MSSDVVNIRDRGRFVRGMPVGPGRPVGRRNRLSKAFLADLVEDWKLHGPAVIERVRQEDPVAYLKVVASLSKIPVDFSPGEELTDRRSQEEMLARLERQAGPKAVAALRAFIAELPK
jgi:hypothetical protein